MQRRLLVITGIALQCSQVVSRRKYYANVRKDMEKGDVGPSEMFADFPKGSTHNRVPEEVHKTNMEAVADAEALQRWFLFSVVLFMIFLLSKFMDPFGEEYARPKGYGFRPVGTSMEKELEE